MAGCFSTSQVCFSEVTELFEIGEEVLVMKQKVFIGMGEITDILRNVEDLSHYFNEQHPMYSSYQLCLRNKQVVYIVSFFHDLGQGGYLEHEVKRNRVSSKRTYA